MNRRTLLILALAPIVASCAVGPKYTPPKLATPAAWHETPAAAVTVTGADRTSLERWWTAFQDPMLDDLVARAVNGSLDLKIAAARVREARAARGIAASAALPQVDAAGEYTRSRRSNAVPPFNAPGIGAVFGPRTQNAFEAGFDASWEIDVFGGVRHDVEAATAQVQASEESARDVLVTLLADVARNYAELRGTQQQIAILDATLKSQQETLEIAKARFDAGLGTALDVERAEGLLEAMTSRRPELERTAKHAVYRLGVLVGKEPAALVSVLEMPKAIPPQPPQVPLTLPSELLSRRPDLRRAERNVAAATARLGVAR
ncbi:MAG TPA: efflux transporter outer membrane subunit, partial [Caldimonas sp.]|nr:efflux transporter outer membrane subunit [Caldimonas sp.]